LLKEWKRTYDQQQTTLLKTKQFQLRATIMAMPVNSSFHDQVGAILGIDFLVIDIKHRSNEDLNKFMFVDDLYIFWGTSVHFKRFSTP